MTRRQTIASMMICFAAALLSLAGWARADGFIIIREPGTVARIPGHFDFAPLSVTYHRVTVDINDQVATTTVDQEFYNPNPQRLEGTYMFPLPAGAHVDKFSMDVNGTMTDAELLDAAKAHEPYVSGETLATSVSYGEDGQAAAAQIEGRELKIGVEKA